METEINEMMEIMIEDSLPDDVDLHGNQQWLKSIMADEYQLRVDTTRGRRPQIKVVSRMHEAEKNDKHMNPQVVSLGPCHHGQKTFKKMERQKRIAARLFVLNSGGEVHTCYEKVSEELDKARESYAPKIIKRLSNQDFKRIMFLDGCFVAYFIEKSNEGAIELEVGSRQFPLIVRDIFLLENQLPFAVLYALMKIRFNSSTKAEEHIIRFITGQTTLTNFGYLPRWQRRLWLRYVPFSSGDDEPLHLLHILHSVLLDSPVSRVAEAYQTRSCFGREPDYTPHQFGSVMELKEAGIKFGISYSRHLTSVKFESNIFFPEILLPRMVINEATISQLLNLIAFEMCFDSHSHAGVTSFLCLMDSLINHAADVKELRAKGILHHALGSDEEVAKLFNELPVDPTSDLQVYKNVKSRVLRHRDCRVWVSIARWLHTHFSSPWTAISFFAAVLLLFLTAVQTFFAVFPRK